MDRAPNASCSNHGFAANHGFWYGVVQEICRICYGTRHLKQTTAQGQLELINVSQKEKTTVRKL
jgi:hypothetical protein